MHLRRLFPYSTAIMLSCKLTMYTRAVTRLMHACYASFSAPTLRYVAIIIDGRF